jgi:hypothetical protein
VEDRVIALNKKPCSRNRCSKFALMQNEAKEDMMCSTVQALNVLSEKSPPKLQEDHRLPVLLNITVWMTKPTLSISSMVWLGSYKHISNFKFYLTIHILMPDSKSKDKNKPIICNRINRTKTNLHYQPTSATYFPFQFILLTHLQ